MRNDDEIQELWHWQIQRLLAECLHTPSQAKEARLMFYLTSYRFFSGKGWRPTGTVHSGKSNNQLPAVHHLEDRQTTQNRLI